MFDALPGPDAGSAVWSAYVGLVHARWALFAVPMMGAYERLAIQRSTTADCLDRDRDAGRIR